MHIKIWIDINGTAIVCKKDIINIDEESAYAQRAKRIGANYINLIG